MDLREDKGWSYGVSGSAQLTEKLVRYVISAPVQADRTGDSIAQLNTPGRRVPVDQGRHSGRAEPHRRQEHQRASRRFRNCGRGDQRGDADGSVRPPRQLLRHAAGAVPGTDPGHGRRGDPQRGRPQGVHLDRGRRCGEDPARSSTSSGFRSRWSKRPRAVIAGDVAHLAAGARFALAVDVEVRAGLGDAARASGCTSSPIRLSITAPRPARPVEPGGRPQMARMCCSNCEVTAPSMVQWPLLCTRGAISLTSGPVGAGEKLDGEHADMAERFGDAQGGFAGFGDLAGNAVRRTGRSNGAGCRRDARSRGNPRKRGGRQPSARPATENSASNWTPVSATAGSPPIASQACRASSGERIHAWPLPS